MPVHIIQNIKNDIRKRIFNTIKRSPRILDITAVSIALLFNAVLICLLDLADSELMPVYFLSLFFIFTFTGRRVDTETASKDLLREGDFVGFVISEDKIHFGSVNAFVSAADSQKLGLRPGQTYISVSDETGIVRVLPLSNVGMIK